MLHCYMHLRCSCFSISHIHALQDICNGQRNYHLYITMRQQNFAIYCKSFLVVCSLQMWQHPTCSTFVLFWTIGEPLQLQDQWTKTFYLWLNNRSIWDPLDSQWIFCKCDMCLVVFCSHFVSLQWLGISAYCFACSTFFWSMHYTLVKFDCFITVKCFHAIDTHSGIVLIVLVSF